MSLPKQINEFDPGTTLTGAEIIPMSQGGLTRRTTASELSSPTLSSFLQSGTGAVARTVQDKERDIVSVKDFGAKGDGVTDITTAFNNAVASLASTVGPREIHFPAGIWRFASKPNVIPTGVMLVGQGRRNTYLLRDYTAGSSTEGFLEWNGATVTADGGGIRHLCPYAATGTTLGAAIKISGASDSSRGDHITCFDFEISGVGTFDYGIYSDGSGITTVGAQGIRDLDFISFSIFQTAQKSIYIKNGVGCKFISAATFAGGGSADVTIDGGGASTSNSQVVRFSAMQISGTLTLQNCNDIQCDGMTASFLTVASTATNGSFMGYLANNPSNSSTSFIVSFAGTGNGVGGFGVSGTLQSVQDGTILQRTGSSANSQKIDLANTSGRMILGVESTGSGNMVTGDTGGATILSSVGAVPVQIGYNQVLVVTITNASFSTLNKIFPGTDAGAFQTASGIYAGTGVPNNSNGSNGDYYLRSDGTAAPTATKDHCYFKAGGTWGGVF